MKKLVKFLVPALAGLALLVALPAALVGADGAGGVTGPAFYVDGELYRTVITPTHHLGDTGAPDESFDIIYQLFGAQPNNVAEAAPGDPDFNGGRWQVHGVTFSDYAGAIADPAVDLNGNGVLDSAEEVEAAIDGGYATDDGVIDSFVCPVIPVPGNA